MLNNGGIKWDQIQDVLNLTQIKVGLAIFLNGIQVH